MSDSSAYPCVIRDLPMFASTRLDTILASTEQALTRAEESLRKAHQARIRSTSQIQILTTPLLQYAERLSRQ